MEPRTSFRQSTIDIFGHLLLISPKQSTFMSISDLPVTLAAKSSDAGKGRSPSPYQMS
jgi:hypothetical protein